MDKEINELWDKVKDKAKINFLQFKKLYEYVVNACNKHNVDPKLIDFLSFDFSLSYKEIKAEIKEKLKELIPDFSIEEKTKREIEEEERYYKELALKQEIEHYEEEFNKRIEEIKNSNIVELETYYKDYYEHIKNFLENKKVNGFIVVGKSGLGKTFNLIKCLKENNKDFVFVVGHLSALGLYKMLYLNKDNKIIVLNDAYIFQNQDNLNILLNALDYDNRKVEWNSISPLTENLVSEFIFNSKIFIITNKLPDNELAEALNNRCCVYTLDFSTQQIIEMLYIIAKKNNYDLSIVDYLKELAEKNIIKNLDLRILDKVYNYKDKELIKQILEIDYLANVVYELIKSGKNVKEQVKEFTEKTGLSRTTYFYIKAKILGKNTDGYDF
jgi:hypothetical protein